MEDCDGEHPFGDTGQLICLGAFLVVWIGDSFLLRQSTFLAAYVPLFIRLAILGLALALAMWLFGSGHVVTGHGHRVDGLVTTGAFRYVRHPLYLASLATYLGLVASTGSLLSLGLWAGIVAFHDHIASYEERRLEEKLGHTYRMYKKATGKWVPRPSKARDAT